MTWRGQRLEETGWRMVGAFVVDAHHAARNKLFNILAERVGHQKYSLLKASIQLVLGCQVRG